MESSRQKMTLDTRGICLRAMTAETVITHLLEAARKKGADSQVGCGLLWACLELGFGRDLRIGGRKNTEGRAILDDRTSTGTFRVGKALFNVVLALPDDKHMLQIGDALEDSKFEVWLLTRSDRVATWRNELDHCEGVDPSRVVVASVEAFVGQNIAELSGFSAERKATQLRALFELYNSRWVAQVGTPGIRIVVK
ncbi:MAG: DUF4928 family protein [Planctomycetota bacterium]|nr:DUF4928 family protein [Planctomycetota bacterium]